MQKIQNEKKHRMKQDPKSQDKHNNNKRTIHEAKEASEEDKKKQ